MFTRRRLLAATAAMAALPAEAQQIWPDRPLRVIVPFGPGGLADVTIRIVGQKLSELIGQQVVVVNQPGAGGIAAARTVLAAPADGYALAMFTNGTAISASLVKELGFDPIKDFTPVSSLGFFDFLFFTASDKPYRTLADLVAAAKARPGALNIGTINIGSSQHLSAVLFNATAGIDTAIVPFKTSPDAIAALTRGDVDLVVEGFVAGRAMLASGKLRALATSGPVRGAGLPEVPTVREAIAADFDVTSWNALFAAAATPAPLVSVINARVQDALADKDVRSKLLELGIEARGGPASAIGKRLADDISKWGAVIARAGIEKQ